MTWKRILMAVLVVTSMVALAGCACDDGCEDMEDEEIGEGEEEEGGFDHVKQPTHSVSINPDSPERFHKT